MRSAVAAESGTTRPRGEGERGVEQRGVAVQADDRELEEGQGERRDHQDHAAEGGRERAVDGVGAVGHQHGAAAAAAQPAAGRHRDDPVQQVAGRAGVSSGGVSAMPEGLGRIGGGGSGKRPPGGCGGPSDSARWRCARTCGIVPDGGARPWRTSRRTIGAGSGPRALPSPSCSIRRNSRPASSRRGHGAAKALADREADRSRTVPPVQPAPAARPDTAWPRAGAGIGLSRRPCGRDRRGGGGAYAEAGACAGAPCRDGSLGAGAGRSRRPSSPRCRAGRRSVARRPAHARGSPAGARRRSAGARLRRCGGRVQGSRGVGGGRAAAVAASGGASGVIDRPSAPRRAGVRGRPRPRGRRVRPDSGQHAGPGRPSDSAARRASGADRPDRPPKPMSLEPARNRRPPAARERPPRRPEPPTPPESKADADAAPAGPRRREAAGRAEAGRSPRADNRDGPPDHAKAPGATTRQKRQGDRAGSGAAMSGPRQQAAAVAARAWRQRQQRQRRGKRQQREGERRKRKQRQGRWRQRPQVRAGVVVVRS